MSPLSAREAAARRGTGTRATPAVAEEVDCSRDLFTPVMSAVLDCCHQGLIDCDRDVGRAFLAAGAEVAHDNCCDGQLWVRLVDAFPSGRPFPSPDTSQPCGITILAARLLVGIVRCAATVDDNGTAPDPAELTAEATGMNRDASILLSAIQCCALPGLSAQAVRIIRWTPTGPQGGCVGGEWEIIIGIDDCGCS